MTKRKVTLVVGFEDEVWAATAGEAEAYAKDFWTKKFGEMGLSNTLFVWTEDRGSR